MENKYIKYGVTALVIIVIAILVIVLQTNKTAVAPTASSTDQTQQNATTTPVVKTTSNTGGVTTYTPTNSANSYATSLAQLTANENKCKSAASAQYKQLYSSVLGVSSFQSYYNTSKETCYMQVSGEIHPAYSTTTTGHIYFRNVSQNSLIAECTDPLGTTLADSDWTCTNKLTGQNINFAAFNGLVSSYKTQ